MYGPTSNTIIKALRYIFHYLHLIFFEINEETRNLVQQ